MPTAGSADPQTLADAAERLMATYERRLPLATVSAVIVECRRRLGQMTKGNQQPLPVLVYRAANDRLRTMSAIAEPVA
jgi:hypothetical protein